VDSSTRRRQPVRKISGSLWLILAILGCIGLISMLADTMILPAIPDFIKYLNISHSMSSWILASFLITHAKLIPISGNN
jgi:hypothetical protein